MKQQNRVVLGLLLLLASAVYLSMVYKDTFGESDSYRMLVGIIDSITYDKPLGARKLYGSNISFGYYALLDIFRPIFKSNLALIVPFMNYINAAFAILMVIPFFFVVKRYWGTVIAVFANILLILLPVWRVTGQYAHPMSGSVLLMFIGLALIGYRSFLSSLRSGWNKLIGLDVLIVAVFALCLMFRLDGILMFPLIPACLLLENYPWKKIVFPAILYSFFPVIIFKVIQSQLAYIKTEANGGIFEQLLSWNNPARYVDYFLHGTLLFIYSLNPLLCLVFFISCIYLISKRRYSDLLFILPTVLLNYIFWLPNASPARHFIYLSPVVAISIAIFLGDIYPRVKSFVQSNRNRGVALAAVLVFCLVISNKYSYSAPTTRMYSQVLMRLGTQLQQLEPKGKPIFVVGDMIPPAAQMQIMSKKTKVIAKETNILTDESIQAQKKSVFKPKPDYINLLYVENEKNKFVFYIQGWKSKINEIKRFFSETDKFDQYYLIVNMLDKNNGKKIDFDPSSLPKKFDILEL
jgi:hypothetical protein